jgi:hypothetical protein
MTVATKLDQKKELKVLYSPPAHPTLVAVPPLTYLMIDGATPAGSSGPAEDPGFGNAIGALYAVAYTLKFEGKAAGRDHVVMPLEGLFWNIGKEGFRPGEGGPMRWTLMILQPEWVGPDAVASAAGTLVEEGRLPSAPPIRLETVGKGEQPRSCTSGRTRRSRQRSRSCAASSRGWDCGRPESTTRST